MDQQTGEYSMLISARPQNLTSGTSPWLSRFPRHCSSRFKTMRLISAAQTKWFIWDMTAPLNKVLVVSLGHHYNCAAGTASQMCPQGRAAPVAEFLSQDPVQSVTKSKHTSGMIQKLLSLTVRASNEPDDQILSQISAHLLPQRWHILLRYSFFFNWSLVQICLTRKLARPPHQFSDLPFPETFLVSVPRPENQRVSDLSIIGILLHAFIYFLIAVVPVYE